MLTCTILGEIPGASPLYAGFHTGFFSGGGGGGGGGGGSLGRRRATHLFDHTQLTEVNFHQILDIQTTKSQNIIINHNHRIPLSSKY